MKQAYAEMMLKGETVFRNEFITKKGTYVVAVVKHADRFYIVKHKNKKLVEIRELR